jgi:hypothetical protein
LDVGEALVGILSGLSLIGNAVTYFIKLLFLYVGFDVPDWMIQLAFVIVLVVTLYAVGSKANKLILVILVFILVSAGAGLLNGLFNSWMP